MERRTVVKHNPPLVLVADDEVHTTLMLERIFQREGFEVQSVNDGIAALESAQRLLPDLILLDIRMPGMNGFDVLRLLRENERTAGIPTILVTANAREPSDVALGLNLGADDYLYKPFAPQELIARAESKMKARQLEETLQRRTRELAALLKMSEDLIQHLEMDELLKLIAQTVFDLLPGDLAAVFELDDDGQLASYHVQQQDTVSRDYGLDANLFMQHFQHTGAPAVWPPDAPLVAEFPSGMTVPLQHGNETFGVLLLAALDIEYDESHYQLFQGVARQVGLALRNAILHEIQLNYALHLEDMVEARTAELQSAQQMLIRSEKLASIGHLAANIAHEINNPLQPITITLDDIVESIHHGQSIDIRDVEIIQESVERIRRIVSQLLEFTGKRNTGPDLQVLDIGHVLERIVDLNRKFFEKEAMAIELNVPALPPVYGSKDQLEQVFMNLTLNAQAAMKQRGKLKISAETVDNEIVIHFLDNGSGIPADLIDKIFDPFFSTKPSGTGLGLFVTYGIIQGHHGTIAVDSKVNAGTRFTIRLPVYQQANVAAK